MLISVTMAKNEADIIEAFVRHNVHFVDTMIIMNHGSSDQTVEILSSLSREGLPVIVMNDTAKAFRQAERITELVKTFIPRLDADYAFPLDADELIKAGSRDALHRALEALPNDQSGLIPWQTYIPSGSSAQSRAEDLDPNPIRKVTQRVSVELQPAFKVVVPRSFAANPDAVIASGNHGAGTLIDGSLTPFAHQTLTNVALAHFPVRSADQLIKKVVLGWFSHRLLNSNEDPSKGPVTAWHWREMYRQVLANGNISADELQEITIRFYVNQLQASGTGNQVSSAAITLLHDPLPVRYFLRYTSVRESSPISSVAAWVDELINSLRS